MSKLTLASLLITTILSLSACGTTPVTTRLEVPPELKVPTVPADKMICVEYPDGKYRLPPKTYEALAVRDTLKTERIKTLEEIIRSTHE